MMPMIPLGTIDANIVTSAGTGGVTSPNSASGFGALVDSVLGGAAPSRPLIVGDESVPIVQEADGIPAGAADEEDAAIAVLVMAMSLQKPLQATAEQQKSADFISPVQPENKDSASASIPQPMSAADVLQVAARTIIPMASQEEPSDPASVIDASAGRDQPQIAASASPIVDGGSVQQLPDGAAAKVGTSVGAVAAVHPRAVLPQAPMRIDQPDQAAPLPSASIAAAHDDGGDAQKLGRENYETFQTRSAKLGKPLLTMATQEVLQADPGVPDGAAILHANDYRASPLLDARGGTSAANPLINAPSAHAVTLATRSESVVRDLGNELVRGIKRGEQELAIRLDPPDLGRIDVRMRFGEDGRLRTVIAADNPHTFDLMRRDADTLTRALADAGIKADPQDLRFDLRQGSSHDQRQRPFVNSHWGRNGEGEKAPEIETHATREAPIRGLIV